MTLQELQAQFTTQMAVSQTLYLLAFGALNWWWLRRTGVEMTLATSVICFLPTLLAVVLAFTSRADEEQYRMRLMVCALMTPILLLFWSTSTPPSGGKPIWPFAVSAGLLHAVSFVGFLYLMGSITTRVPAEESVVAVSPGILRARLLSLRSGAFQAGAVGESEVIFGFLTDEGRRQTATLEFDAAAHVVKVIERVGADGERPVNDAERSMRGPGDPWFDPTRPDAAKVYSRVFQTRNIEAALLASVPARMSGDAVDVPAAYVEKPNEKQIMALLCAVVTRSGWHWRPVFFA